MDERQQTVSIETSMEQPSSGIEAANVSNDTGRNVLSNGKTTSSAPALLSKDAHPVLAGVHGVYGGTFNMTIN